jgi:hypothetical protein
VACGSWQCAAAHVASPQLSRSQTNLESNMRSWSVTSHQTALRFGSQRCVNHRVARTPQTPGHNPPARGRRSPTRARLMISRTAAHSALGSSSRLCSAVPRITRAVFSPVPQQRRQQGSMEAGAPPLPQPPPSALAPRRASGASSPADPPRDAGALKAAAHAADAGGMGALSPAGPADALQQPLLDGQHAGGGGEPLRFKGSSTRTVRRGRTAVPGDAAARVRACAAASVWRCAAAALRVVHARTVTPQGPQCAPHTTRTHTAPHLPQHTHTHTGLATTCWGTEQLKQTYPALQVMLLQVGVLAVPCTPPHRPMCAQHAGGTCAAHVRMCMRMCMHCSWTPLACMQPPADAACRGVPRAHP